MQLDYNEQKEIKMDYITGSENMMQSSSAAGPNNKFTTAKTLGLDYNY